MSNNRHLKRNSGSSRTLLAPTLFGQLPPALQSELRSNALRRTFDTGALIQQVGDGASGFWLIEKGSVQIGVFRADGDFRAVATLGEGDSYGELALMAASTRAVDAIVRSPSELLWIDGGRFETLIFDDSAIMRQLLRAIALEMQELIGYVAGFRGGSSHRRIATVLANAARHADDPLIVITQSEIADLAGVTRATCAKALREFEAEGALRRRYGAVEICDQSLLEQLGL